MRKPYTNLINNLSKQTARRMGEKISNEHNRSVLYQRDVQQFKDGLFKSGALVMENYLDGNFATFGGSTGSNTVGR